ncbi:protein kinase [Pseudofrankia sp. DC12]|uniref:protein kinase domain-containing protein n=1 Tax=Pseudofrankia sp. DC12 TaxID=683315 RepID=UPI000698F2A0|nr:protein kinase [Pseudofrankia sp. DC12]
MQDIALPVRLGPTTLTARIGAGGMGIVYYGLLGPTPVAVKVIRAELADSAEFRARFRREIELMRRVRGVCTARVYAADPDWYPPYLATEFLAGPTLADWILRNGPIVGPSLRTLALGLAEALLAVHRAGVVHRDLKPGNVLLTQGGPKVVDFGIADATDVTVLTRVGTPVGTPGYMSPEQLNGLEVVGPPADVFAWGCTVAYAATARTPFGAGPTDAVLFRVRHDPPNLAGIPEDLAGLVDEALRKDAAARPDAAELVRRLLRLVLGTQWAADVVGVGGASPAAEAGFAAPPGEGGVPARAARAQDEGIGGPDRSGADSERSDGELARGVTRALDRLWPIRAYLPPRPTAAPPTSGAPGAPSRRPGAVPGPPASHPAPMAIPSGPAGADPASRPPLPPVGPGGLAPGPWPPPAGPPVGSLPVLGRPAPPMPPVLRHPVAAPSAPAVPSMPAGPPMPAVVSRPPMTSLPPGAVVAPGGMAGGGVAGPAAPVGSTVAGPPAGPRGPIGPPVGQPTQPARGPVPPGHTGPHTIARPPSAPAPGGWLARHRALATASLTVGALLLVAILVASSLLIFRVVTHGADSSGRPGTGPASVTPPASGHAAVPSTAAGTGGKGASAPAAAATTVAGPCHYWTTAATGPAPGLPPAAARVPTGASTMIVRTNYGTLSAELDAAVAPCAVYALHHLATAGYYDGSFCPRETIAPEAAVSVLQCGDPTGSGAGSPGFAYAAERTAATGFGPGTLAMATTSRPDANGAQFLISYDEPTPAGLAAVAAHYTVIGRITAGLDVLDRLVGAGIEGGGSEGPPASEARIESVTIAE